MVPAAGFDGGAESRGWTGALVECLGLKLDFGIVAAKENADGFLRVLGHAVFDIGCGIFCAIEGRNSATDARAHCCKMERLVMFEL